jgi:hypothetical protein
MDLVASQTMIWFAFLSQQPGIDEMNFWQPGVKTLGSSFLTTWRASPPERWRAGVQIFPFDMFRNQTLAFAPIPSRVSAHGYLKHSALSALNTGTGRFIVSNDYHNGTEYLREMSRRG